MSTTATPPARAEPSLANAPFETASRDLHRCTSTAVDAEVHERPSQLRRHPRRIQVEPPAPGQVPRLS